MTIPRPRSSRQLTLDVAARRWTWDVPDLGAETEPRTPESVRFWDNPLLTKFGEFLVNLPVAVIASSKPIRYAVSMFSR